MHYPPNKGLQSQDSPLRMGGHLWEAYTTLVASPGSLKRDVRWACRQGLTLQLIQTTYPNCLTRRGLPCATQVQFLS
jgi:hypothetical protein